MIKYMLLLIPWPFESLKAQPLQLNTNIGYYTGSNLKASKGRFIVDGAPCYSAAVSYSIRTRKKKKEIVFQLQYAYASSSWHFKRYDTYRKKNMGNMTMHSIYAGAGKTFGKRSVQPYGSVSIGVTLFDPDSVKNVKRFTSSFAATCGIKIAITSFIGVILQAEALLPVMYNRVYVGWEPDTGLVTTVAPIGIMFSGQITGGIYCKLPQ